MRIIEVFADVACPFTHVGLRRFTAYRREQGVAEPVLRVRAWPLELVNDRPHRGPALAPKVSALRTEVAPELFVGFDEAAFPQTTLPALAAEAAAYRDGVEAGERFSLALRAALFERGLDVSDDLVLDALRQEFHVPRPTPADKAAVQADYDEGKRRKVTGSPHFFTEDGSFFCPSLDIEERDGTLDVSFDAEGFQGFMTAAFSGG